jgi:hypothetical protein
MDLLALTLLRILVSLLIFKWPLIGIVASLWLDSTDWHLYPFKTQSDYATYQIWDKVLDTFYLSIAFYTSLFWKDLKARTLSIFLFCLRTFGVILFILTSNNLFLFLFPNIFENFFILYLLYKLITKNDQLFLPKELGILFLIAIAVPKLFQEYLLHFADITAHELFGLSNQQSFWLLFLIIAFVYFMILWWRIELQKQK